MKRSVIGLVLFALVFIALAVNSYTRDSATWDEPQHLTAGYYALTRGDYRVDPEHPPLLRMWAAIPAALMNGVRADLEPPAKVATDDWLFYDQFLFAHKFLYQLNDADRLLYAGRFMIVLLGVSLGILLFSWANEWLGFWPAVAVLALYTFEPNLLAHSRLVTTDFGATVFIFGAVYFAWRRPLTAGNVAALVAFVALAMVSKFTAVLLGPVVLVVLAVRVRRWRVVASIAVALVIVSYVTIWATYGFRHAPATGSDGFHTTELARRRLPALTAVVEWTDHHRLLPNAYVQGFLLGQTKAQNRAGYLAGEIRREGWWYYFPVVMIIKTPLALLALVVMGLVVIRRDWILLVPVAVFLGAAMLAKLNIGLRHVLPVYPFLLLIAGAAVAELLRRRQRWLVITLVAAAGLELTTVYPDPLAFFNLSIGGPRHGDEYLVDSNLDWGQDLKRLKKWMDANQVAHVNLAYFGTADPSYYGINCTYLPGSPLWADDQVALPQLPGYVAISATNLRGVYLSPQLRNLYKPFVEEQPVAMIGRSIRVYYAERK